MKQILIICFTTTVIISFILGFGIYGNYQIEKRKTESGNVHAYYEKEHEEAKKTHIKMQNANLILSQQLAIESTFLLMKLEKQNKTLTPVKVIEHTNTIIGVINQNKLY